VISCTGRHQPAIIANRKSMGYYDALHRNGVPAKGLSMSSAKGRIYSLAVVLLLGMASACGFLNRLQGQLTGGKPDLTAVRVGDKIFTKADLNRYFESRLSEFRDPESADKIKSNLLDSFIDDKLLLDQADKMKIQPDAESIKKAMTKITTGDAEGVQETKSANLEQDIIESLKTQQYLRDHLLKGVSISDQDCEAYYTEHAGEFVKNDVVHVLEILVEDTDTAEKILKMLKARSNRNFEDLAKVYSKGASASTGGDLGLFQRGELPEEFEKVIFRLTPGSISKIVSSKYGYHIFRLQEKILAHQQKLIEVEDQIKSKLLLEREREIVNNELATLRKSIPVEIRRSELDFTYVSAQFATTEGSVP
jgi:parvulin-like peptidyl-prolyl isomerase